MKLYFDALLKALHAKNDRPFEIIELQSFLSLLSENKETGSLMRIFNLIGTGIVTIGAMHGQDALKEIDGLIKQHNNHTDNFQESVATARKALEDHNVAIALNHHNELRDAANDAGKRESEASQNTNKIQQEIENLKRAIRQHQRPAEQLNTEMHSFLGRSELKFEIKDTGYSISRNGHPALHLSEGERSAIAFMYFLKSLEDTSFNLKTGIVVIDDPVSSLDTNSLYSAFGFMKSRTTEAGQLFILTHNFTFFRLVRNWFQHMRGKDKKKISQRIGFYMLSSTTHNNERSAALQPLDPLLNNFESEYHYLFKRVYEEAYRNGTGSMEINYGMPNIARRLLESFLAFRLPGNSEALHYQLEKISFDDVAKKTRILRFLHTHSHYGQIAEPEHDLSVLSETQPILKDLLSLMQSVDPAHYDGMKALINPHLAQNIEDD